MPIGQDLASWEELATRITRKSDAAPGYVLPCVRQGRTYWVVCKSLPGRESLPENGEAKIEERPVVDQLRSKCI